MYTDARALRPALGDSRKMGTLLGLVFFFSCHRADVLWIVGTIFMHTLFGSVSHYILGWLAHTRECLSFKFYFDFAVCQSQHVFLWPLSNLSIRAIAYQYLHLFYLSFFTWLSLSLFIFLINNKLDGYVGSYEGTASSAGGRERRSKSFPRNSKLHWSQDRPATYSNWSRWETGLEHRNISVW